MNRSMTLPVSAFSATELALWSWLVFGAVVTALIPQARAQSVIGWLPFWLIVAPLLDLALFHRGRLLSASRAVVDQAQTVRARPRRRIAKQARSMRRRRTVNASAACAAVFEV